MTLGFEPFGGGDELVIVAHSWMTTHASWAPLRPYLDGDRFTWLFADLRGYGLSRGLAGPYTAATAAADLLRLADQRGVERFHVVGHSMGGMIAQRLMVDAPERLRTATLVAPVLATGVPLDGDGEAAFRTALHDDGAWGSIAAMMTGERLSPAFARAHLPAFRATSDPEAMAGYLEMWTQAGFADHMPGRETPTLIVAGRYDIEPLRPEAVAQATAGWFDDLTVADVDTGHFPMLESPPRCAALIGAHLAR